MDKNHSNSLIFSFYNIASEASYVYISQKIPRNGQKMPEFNFPNATFWVIFKTL